MTEISVCLEEEGEVSIIVYDQLGREVEVLANGYFSAAKHVFNFKGGDLAPGIYICKLINNGKMVNTLLIKQ